MAPVPRPVATPDLDEPETVVEAVAEAAPSAAKAAVTLIAANFAMKAGTRMLQGLVEKTILRGRYGESAAERILREKRVKGSAIASTAARVATRSRPGALLVGAGLLAKTLFDKGGERRARLAGKPRTKR